MGLCLNNHLNNWNNENDWVTVEFLWINEEHPSENGEDTPGFEISFVFLAMALVLFWKRKYLV